MKLKILKITFLFFLISFPLQGQYCLIPMDFSQTDHLKAYGVAYWTLQKGINVEWLLNYRGGSFSMAIFPGLESECRIRGVKYKIIDATQMNQIYATIESEIWNEFY